jgi:hypothetical protein
MKTIHILEADDKVRMDDWCRPLSLVSMSGGHGDGYSFRSCYSGSPENNVKWAKVNQIFGKVWNGSPVKEFTFQGISYEFARGDIPVSHQLTEEDY